MSDFIYEIRLVLRTEFGEFNGRKVLISQENYDSVVKMSKSYHQAGFELTLENGDFVIFSPDVVKKSILTIKKKPIKENTDVQE